MNDYFYIGVLVGIFGTSSFTPCSWMHFLNTNLGSLIEMYVRLYLFGFLMQVLKVFVKELL
jgi:hypothetical protein